jgi:hypothetical protein
LWPQIALHYPLCIQPPPTSTLHLFKPLKSTAIGTPHRSLLLATSPSFADPRQEKMVCPQKKPPSTSRPSRIHVLHPLCLPAGTRRWRVGDNPTIDTPQIARELPVESEPNINFMEPQTEEEENEQIRRATEESIQLANAHLPAQTAHTYSSSSATVLPHVQHNESIMSSRTLRLI